MLEHYGRIRQSDFDQIEQISLQVKQKKDQTMSAGEAHLVPFSNCNEGLDAEYTAPTTPGKAAQNAAQHTAAEGVNEWNSTETPSTADPTQPLTSTALNGKRRQQETPHGIPEKPTSGGHGSRTRNRFPGTSFPMRPLAIRLPSNACTCRNLVVL